MRYISTLGLVGFAAAAVACGPPTQTCTTGEQTCSGTTHLTCQDGELVVDAECPLTCSPELGCVVCAPGTGTCDDDRARRCRADGSGYDDPLYCDPLQGITCSAAGVCEGPCASLGDAYFGCDYYPTVTGNIVDSFYDFAVAVSNTAATDATITVEAGALATPDVFTVPADSVVVRNLPWVQSLKLCTGGTSSSDCPAMPLGALSTDGAFRLRSTLPVTVYQFNPIQYDKPGAETTSQSNDASLLFPTNAWGNDHYVASFHQSRGVFPSLMAVTAHLDDTEVTITTTAESPGGGGAPAFVAGVPQTVTLDAGDVIELASMTGDFTGTRVTSDQPVQVIGGHFCAYVPTDDWGFCDHLEEVMLPIAAMGLTYVINAPAVVSIPAGKEQCVRIIATEPNTELLYDPPQLQAPTAIAAAGDFIEISRQAASYVLTSNHKILVTQLMEGSTIAGGTGDPAMTVAVPVEQFRTEYRFHAPTNYETNYVDITASIDATILLDGEPIPTILPIGSSGWGLSRVTPLGAGPRSDGNHLITGDTSFAISVYGYGQDTSYWYPGGLDLSAIE